MLDANAHALRIDPDRLHRLLRMGVLGRTEEPPADGGRVDPKLTRAAGWERWSTASLRIEKAGARGAMPRLVFATDALMHDTRRVEPGVPGAPLTRV